MSAWDRIPISTLYHLHLVFLHDNGIQDAQLQTKILNEAKKISKFVSKYGVLVDVSSVHLWDFDVESFTTTARSTERRLLLQDVETLTTEVDKYVNWIGVGIAQPLIKMAILVSDKQIKLLDTNVSYCIGKLGIKTFRANHLMGLRSLRGEELVLCIWMTRSQQLQFCTPFLTP